LSGSTEQVSSGTGEQVMMMMNDHHTRMTVGVERMLTCGPLFTCSPAQGTKSTVIEHEGRLKFQSPLPGLGTKKTKENVKGAFLLHGLAPVATLRRPFRGCQKI